jgi:hypothetical protein
VTVVIVLPLLLLVEISNVAVSIALVVEDPQAERASVGDVI